MILIPVQDERGVETGLWPPPGTILPENITGDRFASPLTVEEIRGTQVSLHFPHRLSTPPGPDEDLVMYDIWFSQPRSLPIPIDEPFWPALIFSLAKHLIPRPRHVLYEVHGKRIGKVYMAMALAAFSLNVSPYIIRYVQVPIWALQAWASASCSGRVQFDALSFKDKTLLNQQIERQRAEHCDIIVVEMLKAIDYLYYACTLNTHFPRICRQRTATLLIEIDFLREQSPVRLTPGLRTKLEDNLEMIRALLAKLTGFKDLEEATPGQQILLVHDWQFMALERRAREGNWSPHRSEARIMIEESIEFMRDWIDKEIVLRDESVRNPGRGHGDILASIGIFERDEADV